MNVIKMSTNGAILKFVVFLHSMMLRILFQQDRIHEPECRNGSYVKTARQLL